MSIKKGKEVYHSLEDLIKILKSNKNAIEYDIKMGILKGQYFVKDTDLKAFLEARKKQKEIEERLKKGASSKKLPSVRDDTVFDDRRIEL